MARKREVAQSPVQRVVNAFTSVTIPLVEGLVASDGALNSAVVTIGATWAAGFTKVIDPKVDLSPVSAKAHFLYKLTNLKDEVASFSYYWRAYLDGQGTVNPFGISATYATDIGSLASITPTLSGLLDTSKLKQTPFVLQLMAVGTQAGALTVEVKNESFITLTGHAIPGV